MSTTGTGSIVWTDLTVPDADAVRDFYASVVGWTPVGIDMGGYQDYSMNARGGDTVCGICWARGQNAGMPAQWLVYIQVADIDESVRRCERLGGKLLRPVQDLGSYGRSCVIQDPAGAVAALIQPPLAAA